MLFTGKDIFRIILPLFVEQLLAVTLGVLDSIMVSTVGEAAVSGVSLVDTVNLLLSYVFSAFATGGAVVCSQFLGRRDYELARSGAKQLLYSTFSVALVVSVLALTFRTPLLHLVFGSIEADVMGHASVYFLFTAMSYPFLALYNGGAALFRAMGNSRVSMLVSVFMNVFNFFGNAILIFGFGLGAGGAAISTLVSRALGAIIIITLAHSKRNSIYIEKILHFKPDLAIIKRILGIGVPSGMENGMFQFGKLLTQSLISTFTTAAIAANAVAGMVANFQYAVGGAVGLAMIPIIGQCIGAGEKAQAKYYVKRLLRIEYVAMIAVSLILTVLVKPIVHAYNLSEESASLAVLLILIHNVFTVTIWPCAFTLTHAFRAASDVRFTMITSIVSMWVFRVCASYLIGGYFGLGVLGVWIAMFIDWLVRGGLFVWRITSGVWLTKYKPLKAKQEE